MGMTNKNKKIALSLFMVIIGGLIACIDIIAGIRFHPLAGIFFTWPLIILGSIVSILMVDRIDEYNGIAPHDGMFGDRNLNPTHD